MPTQPKTTTEPTQTNKRETRKDRALVLRDCAVKLLHAYGRPFETPQANCLVVSGRIFSLVLRTPEHRGWKTPPHILAEAAQMGVTIKDWPFYVKVMAEHHTMPRKKITVLSLEWDAEGNAHVAQFRRGEWETLLQKAANEVPMLRVVH